MADQVEISNVGGEGGVASEATLAGLTRSIERLAASTGKDPKSEAGKVQKMHTRTLREDIKAIEDKIDAQEAYTGALKRSTAMMGGLLGGISNLITGGIGLLTSSVVQFAETVISGDESLSGLVKSIPVFGSVLSRFTDIIDESFDAFQTMASSGASFGYNLGELRSSARELRLGFSELSSFVTGNSKRLAAFGGTVDGGIRATRALTTALGSDVRQQFTAMGLTTEELNEQLSFFQYVTRAGNSQRIRDSAQEAAAVESLTKNMLTLSKLTGKDIQQQRDEMMAAQQGMAFQMKMARLSEDQQASIQSVLSNAATMGEDYVEAVRREFLGLPPLTEEQAILLATQGNVIREMVGQMNAAMSVSSEQERKAFTSKESQREQLADLIEQQIKAAGSLENLLAAGGAGLGGAAGIIAEQFGTTAEFVGRYLSESADGSIQFARDKFIESLEEASEGPGPDTELDAIAAFREGLREARESITNNFTNPMMKALSPALTSVADAFNDFVGEGGENTLFQNAIGVMREKIEAIVPKINLFMEAFAADPEQAIADVVADIGNFFRDAIFGKMVDVDPRDLETDMQRQGGLIQSLRNGISALFTDGSVLNSLIDGVTTVTNGLREGFSEFWNDSASNQLREDIKSMFQKIVDEIILMISDNSFLFGGRADEIRESRLRESAQGGEIDDSLVEYRSELVRIQEAIINNSLEQIRFGEFNSVMQAKLNEALSEIEDFSTVEQMTAYQDQIDQARRDFVNSQVQAFMDQINQLDTMVNQHKNTEYQGRGGIFGIGAQTPEEQEEARNAELRAIREQILSQIEDTGDTEAITRLTTALNNIESFNNGTKGFEDFGSGTLAMLHGREAVIPLDSPLGQMIDNINSGAAIGSRPNTGRMPGLDFENRSTSVSSDISKVEIDNISLLTENIQDMKNQLSSNINTANQGSIDSMKELNRLMSQVLTVLQAMAEDADGIERNTRSMGGNIANGRISAIR